MPFRGATASGDIEFQGPASHLVSGEERCLHVMRSRHVGGGTIDALALPTDRQRAEYQPVPDLLDIVERRMFPASGASRDARLVIEAVAHPFVRPA